MKVSGGINIINNSFQIVIQATFIQNEMTMPPDTAITVIYNRTGVTVNASLTTNSGSQYAV